MGLFMITVFISVGYAALNQNLSIAGALDYEKLSLWAINLGYDNSNTGTTCTTVQCMIDCLPNPSSCLPSPHGSCDNLNLNEKKAIAIGERDGIPGTAIEAVLTDAGAEVVFASTESYVDTAIGGMDLGNQSRIGEAYNTYGRENLVVVLGSADGEAASVYAETVTTGDPTFSGVLSGVALHLPVFHVVESDIKAQCDPDVWDEQIGMMEMVLDTDDLIEEVKAVRDTGSICS